MSDAFLSVWPVILAGGSGTRLWPLSRALHPKQYLEIAGERTLFQQAIARVAAVGCPTIDVGPPCVVASEHHRMIVIDQLQAIDVKPTSVLLEPVGRNTAPALTLGALEATRSAADPILIVTPADHLVTDLAACTIALRRAVASADDGHLVLLGIRAIRPETSYGYIDIAPGEDASAGAAVMGFFEKPDLATAQSYLRSGYSWNSGIFVMRASVWLRALARFRPDIAVAAEAAWRQAEFDGPFVRFEAAAFASIPAESIDRAVMELAALPGSGLAVKMFELDAGWSDLGSWDAVWEVSERDGSGNATHGDVALVDSHNTLVHAASRLVSVIGLDDVTVVETADAVLVAHRSRSGAIGDMTMALAQAGRKEATEHLRVYRPWGWYEQVDRGARFQVKRIVVKPGERLSLQMHHHRAEHWIVVSGMAEVTNGDVVSVLSENQSTYIPIGCTHRLANPGKVPLEIIEVQSGPYLGEDDIVRFEDNYGRVG